MTRMGEPKPLLTQRSLLIGSIAVIVASLAALSVGVAAAGAVVGQSRLLITCITGFVTWIFVLLSVAKSLDLLVE